LDCKGKLEQRARAITKEQSMIRNLKVLVAAAMALAAFGAFSASGAQAAEFHCGAAPCTATLKPDETANTKTSHHVFIVENAAKTISVSFTCGSLSGASTVASPVTTPEIEVGGTVGAANALVYNECLVNGSGKVTVDMNGCKYNFTAGGTVQVTGCTNAAKQIEVTTPECNFDVPQQGPLAGITYHNIGAVGSREVTVSANVTLAGVHVTGTEAGCFGFKESESLTGTYTTGNTIVTGDSGGVKVDTWWL
jgi:hypothetical protein